MASAASISTNVAALMTGAASPGIGTPVDIGFGSNPVNNMSWTMAITHDAAAGSFIGVWAIIAVGRPFNSFADSKGNSYTMVTVSPLGGVAVLWFFYCANPTTPLTVAGGDGFTLTWTTLNEQPLMNAVQITGLNTSTPLDITGAVSSGTGSSFASPITTGTLNFPNEVVISAAATNGPITGYTPDAGNGFTSISKNQQTSGAFLGLDYKIVSSTASQNSSPQWTTSRVYAGVALTFH